MFFLSKVNGVFRTRLLQGTSFVIDFAVVCSYFYRVSWYHGGEWKNIFVKYYKKIDNNLLRIDVKAKKTHNDRKDDEEICMW